MMNTTSVRLPTNLLRKAMSRVRARLRALLAHLPWLKAVQLVVDDLWWGIRLRTGRIETDSGTTHATLTLEESIRYIEVVTSDYKRYGGLVNFGGVAAEVGPGDNSGVALLMRGEGCDRVDLIDRYFSRRDPAKHHRIYEALSAKYDLGRFKHGFLWSDQDLAGITQKVGHPAETYFRKCARGAEPIYDVIVSRAVMQHLFDPLGALEAMTTCLKPGGRMIHKIDLRDLNMFTPQNHELTFLCFPPALYRYMTKNSGRPNRVLFHRYRDLLERLKAQHLIDYDVFITRLVGIGDLTPHLRPEEISVDMWNQAERVVESSRRHFAREFVAVDSRDLAVAGVFLGATRT